MPLPVRLAVIFVNYGAYHRARALALQSIARLDPHFIELASAQSIYPWHASAREANTLTITTLAQGSYERVPKARLTRALWQQLAALKPNVVVGAGYSEIPMLGAALWAALARRPYVLMFETNEWDRPRPVWEELPKRWMLRLLVDGVICGGASHRRYLQALGVPESRIWDKYDVVDNEYFARGSAAARAEPRLSTASQLSRAYFLYVGRLSPEKNLELLLQAYHGYRQVDPGGCGLAIVGDGPERDHLREVATQLGLEDIIWAGQHGVATLPGFYAHAKALVLPSLVEPWGLVVNEAMACGLPVIVSNRCGCAADLVREGENGWTFEPGEAEALRRHMLSIGKLDPVAYARMGDASRSIISAFTPQAFATNLAECVASVAHRT